MRFYSLNPLMTLGAVVVSAGPTTSSFETTLEIRHDDNTVDVGHYNDAASCELVANAG